MLEILHFIFSSFEIWLGTLILIAVTGTSLGAGIGAGIRAVKN